MTLARNCLTCLIALLSISCGGGGSGGSSGSAGQTSAPVLRIHVTDKPFPITFVDNANVVIKRIEVKDANGVFQTAFSGSATIDLVPLVGGVTTQLVAAGIPAGTYSEVRLIVDAGDVVLNPSAVVAGGSHVFSVGAGNLRFPSGAQTGIKVNIDPPIVVTTGLSADLTLDFDLEKNFVFNGPITHSPGVRRVLFTPVVKAINTSTSGRIALDVLTDRGSADSSDDVAFFGAEVRVLDGNATVVATGLTAIDGHVEIQLAPGTYDLEVEAVGHDLAGAASHGDLDDVSVTVGNAHTVPALTLAQNDTGSIEGEVHTDAGTPSDTSDDVVVEGVEVSAELRTAGTVAPETTQTDPSGQYALSGLTPGAYDVTLAPAGFVSQSIQGVTPGLAGSPLVINATLVAMTDAIEGTLETSGGPISQGSVDILVTDVNVVSTYTLAETVTTDAAGGYALPSVPTGTYEITFTFTDAGTTVTATIGPVAVVGDDDVSTTSGGHDALLQ